MLQLDFLSFGRLQHNPDGTLYFIVYETKRPWVVWARVTFDQADRQAMKTKQGTMERLEYRARELAIIWAAYLTSDLWC